MLAQSRVRMRRAMPDPFAVFPCLEDFDLLAGDGHFIAAACHDTAAPRGSSGTGAKGGDTTTRVSLTKYATGHLYTLDLRTHRPPH